MENEILEKFSEKASELMKYYVEKGNKQFIEGIMKELETQKKFWEMVLERSKS